MQEANKKLGELKTQHGGAIGVVQSAPLPPHAILQPCGMKAAFGLPKAPPLTISVTYAMNKISSSIQAANRQAEINQRPWDEIVEQETRGGRDEEGQDFINKTIYENIGKFEPVTRFFLDENTKKWS